MYNIISNLLSDKKDGAIFTCFGLYHILYILLFLLIGALAFLYLKRADSEKRQRVTRMFINIPFGLYIADFFLMPFAYGEIDIEKLPFHICTAMCVACFLSSRISILKPIKPSLSLFGFISNLVYLLYPAGVMWYATHPLSYRVVQTIVFHGLMTVYGLLSLAFDKDDKGVQNWRCDLAVITSMTLWAMLGNLLYNGTNGDYSHLFSWFFVVRDPFYILPEGIAPFVMPLVNVAVFFGVGMLVRAIFALIRPRINIEQT